MGRCAGWEISKRDRRIIDPPDRLLLRAVAHMVVIEPRLLWLYHWELMVLPLEGIDFAFLIGWRSHPEPVRWRIVQRVTVRLNLIDLAGHQLLHIVGGCPQHQIA